MWRRQARRTRRVLPKRKPFIKKKYTAALPFFRQALADTLEAGPYDLYYGAKTAAAAGEHQLALRWLGIGQRKVSGLATGRRHRLKPIRCWHPLHQLAGWPALNRAFSQALSRKKAAEQQRAADWLQTITRNHKKITPGFALYFSKAGTVKVPYLVYVSRNYKPGRPLKTIVYLHGGVHSYSDFDYKKPDNSQEPIFAAADSIGALVIYPFARKTFGWVDQPAAFRQVLTILSEAGHRYAIDPNNICLAGMSNGASACFWFAGKDHTPFRAFLALSGMPELAIGPVNFARLTKHIPFTA